MGKKNKFTTEQDILTEKKKKFSMTKLKSRKKTVLKIIENHKWKIEKRQLAIARLTKEIQNLNELKSQQLIKE